MQRDDRIVIRWERTDVTRYKAVVPVEQFARLVGLDLDTVLALGLPSDAMDDGPLDLADELADVEDSGPNQATEVGYECQREDITVRLAKRD